MKRGLAVLLILALLCPVGALAADFTATGQHEGTAAYSRAFLYVAQADELVTLAVERALFKGNRGPALLEAVRADVAETAAFLGEGAQPCEIFVVQKLDGSAPICTGSRIYCTSEQAQAGAYRDLLPRAMTGCADWQLQGFYAYRAGEQADTAALAAYYQVAEDLDQLSLSPLWFNEKPASAEEVARSQATRTALSAYLIERDGAAAFLQTAYGDAARTAWLHAIGVERDYADAYPGVEEHFEFLGNARYTFTARSLDWKLTLYTQWGYHVTDSPRYARRFLYDVYSGINTLLNVVQAEAPAYYARFAGGLTLGGDISAYMDAGPCMAVGRAIYVGWESIFFHELLHVLIPYDISVSTSPMWAAEGMCDLSFLRYDLAAEYGREATAAFIQESLEDPTEDLADADFTFSGLRTRTARYFEALGNTQNVSLYAYWQRMAYEELATGAGKTLHDRYPALQEKEGNELFMYGADVMADYMIDHYGLEAFLRYLYDQSLSFEACFGVPYEEAKEACFAQLRQKYEGELQ